MSLRTVLILAVFGLNAGCVSLNPYVRAKSTMMHPDPPDGANYCWVRAGDACTAGCQDEKAAPSLDECVELWRHRVTWLTSELDAAVNLAECMQTKGWERLWISGVIHM